MTPDKQIEKLQHEKEELKRVIRAYDRAINALPREVAVPLIDSIAENYNGDSVELVRPS